MNNQTNPHSERIGLALFSLVSQVLMARSQSTLSCVTRQSFVRVNGTALSSLARHTQRHVN